MYKNILYYKVIILSTLMMLLLSLSVFSQQTQRDLISAYNAKIKAENDSMDLHYRFLTAASDGNIVAVNKYIKEGIYLDYRDISGATALFYAVNTEQTEVVKTLLYYGANPNIKTFDHFSPLMNASSFSFPMAELLLLIPATELNTTDDYGTTALHYAAYYGQYEIVDMLLFYGADVNKTTKYEYSTTYMAAFSGSIDIMDLLISKGMDPFVENSFENNALSISIINNDTILFDYLRTQKGYQPYVNKNFSSLIKNTSESNNTYALSILVGNDSIKKESEEIKSAYKSAYRYGSKEFLMILKNNNFQNSYSPILNSLWIGFSTAFNNDDYCSYFGLGMDDARYKIGIGFKFGTRFKYRAFLDPIDEHSFYQHWERRNTFAVSLNKRFYLYESPLFTVLPYVAVDAQWQWAKYRGRNISLKGKFILAPELGIGVQMKGITFNVGYQYLNMDIYKVSPHRIKLGIKGSLFIKNKPEKYYPPWM